MGVVTPLGKNVVISVKEEESNNSISSIVLTEKKIVNIVESIGPEVESKDIVVGDEVFFNPMEAVSVSGRGKGSKLIIEADKIVAVIKR